MSHILANLEVLPLYGQVVVQDRDAMEVPVWQESDGNVTVAEQALAVMTRSDVDGLVRLVAVAGDGPLDGVGSEVFVGQMAVPSGHIVVGSTLAAHVADIDIGGPRNVAVRIYVDPADMDATEQVTVVLGNLCPGSVD